MEPIQKPEFIDPQPGRLQHLAIKAAGMLLHRQTAHSTLEGLATEVGGYDAQTDPAGSVQYTAEISPGVKMSLGDETTTPRPQQRYKSGADFQDASGTDLGTAVARTLKGHRSEGPLAQTVRGRTARRLAKYATKGVGAQTYIKASK